MEKIGAEFFKINLEECSQDFLSHLYLRILVKLRVNLKNTGKLLLLSYKILQSFSLNLLFLFGDIIETRHIFQHYSYN